MTEVEVKIVSDTTCLEAVNSSNSTHSTHINGVISEDMLCAGTKGKFSCGGGAPQDSSPSRTPTTSTSW